MCIKEVRNNVIVNITGENGFLFTTTVDMLVALTDGKNYLIGEPQDLERVLNQVGNSMMNIDDYIKWQKETYDKDSCHYLLDYFTLVRKDI